MQVTKTDHKSGTGIYAKSIPVVKDLKQAKQVAQEMIDWLNAENGQFKGEHSSAFAMAHCQVVEHDMPYRIFVVAKDLVAPSKIEKNSKQTLENCFFEAQAIFNAEILEAQDTIMKEVPRRKVTPDAKNKHQVDVEVVMEKTSLNNLIEVPEGCMSFPHRKPKNMHRYHTIKVRYQYLKKGVLGEKLATFEGYVSGLKAHIIQHETDHFDGRNIYHNES